MRSRIVLSLSLLAGFTPSLVSAPVPKTVPIDPGAVAAYTKLGGEYGLMKSTDRWLPASLDSKAPFFETAAFADGRSQFIDAEDHAVAGIPAFRFRKFPTGDLPPVNVPFGLDFSDSDCTDADLESLKDLKNLTRLSLIGTKASGEGLKDLGANKTLVSLTLGDGRHARGTFNGWQGFAPLKNIARLSFSRTTLTEDGWKELKEMPRLTTLNLHGSEVSDAELKDLKGLEQLETLVLHGTKVTDKGIAELKLIGILRALDLSGTKVTGAGISELGNLTALDLNGTPVTDARVREMKGLKRLKTLGLGGCDVTDAVVDDLKRFPALSVLDLEYS